MASSLSRAHRRGSRKPTCTTVSAGPGVGAKPTPARPDTLGPLPSRREGRRRGHCPQPWTLDLLFRFRLDRADQRRAERRQRDRDRDGRRVAARAQRRFAILGGGVLAIVLRLVLTSFATRLLRLPLISAGGGLVLFFVAWGLLDIDTEGGAGDAGGAAAGLRRAIQLIVVADVTMSLDNVIAGAAARPRATTALCSPACSSACRSSWRPGASYPP